jgi:zona occludens toxin (predicted ATPase)
MEPMNRLHQGRSRKLALLLVLIFGLFMAVQTVHHHSFAHPDDPHCALCQVVHASAAVVIVPALPVLTTSIADAPPAEVQSPLLAHSAPICIRPPPAAV